MGDHDAFRQIPQPVIQRAVSAGRLVTNEELNKLLADIDNPDGPHIFRYRKPNTAAQDWSDEVILYEIYDQWPEDGIIVCFADDHCEIVTDQKHFEELIK